MGALNRTPEIPRTPQGPIGLLSAAHAEGVRLSASPPYWHPALSTSEEMVAELETQGPILRAILLGLITGHRWAPCDKCGEGTMVAGSGRPVCRLTPACTGHHKPESLARSIRPSVPVRRL